MLGQVSSICQDMFGWFWLGQDKYCRASLGMFRTG